MLTLSCVFMCVLLIGSDLLRLCREDLIQICGTADGIRLYNALQAKYDLLLLIRLQKLNRREDVYRSWKVVEFKTSTFQAWKVIKSHGKSTTILPHLWPMCMFLACIYIVIDCCQWINYVVIKYDQITITWNFSVKVTDIYAAQSCDIDW